MTGPLRRAHWRLWIALAIGIGGLLGLAVALRDPAHAGTRPSVLECAP